MFQLPSEGEERVAERLALEAADAGVAQQVVAGILGQGRGRG